jgi:hypothetical protein
MRYLMTILIFGVIAASVSAQETKDPHTVVRQLLDEDVAVVAWVDLKQIDLNALPDFFEAIGVPVPQESVDEAKLIRDALVELGVERAYLLLSLADLESGPEAFVLPVPNPRSVRLLLKSLMPLDPQLKMFERENPEQGSFIVVGRAQQVDQIAIVAGKPSQELETALASVDGPHGIAMALGEKEMGTMFSSMLSFFDDDFAELAKMAEVMSSVRWFSVSGQFPPTSGTIRLESNSPESAKKIRDWFTELAAKRIKEQAADIPLTIEESAVVSRSDSLEKSLKAMLAFRKLISYKSPLGAINSMRRITISLHNFYQAYQHLPPQSLVSRTGERLLSWRVLILPYLDQNELYQQFHLDEPWDSPHNLTLLEKMPEVYKPSSVDTPVPAGFTTFQATLTADSPFGKRGKPLTFADILDGLSNTIWLVEAPLDKAVEWTKPADLIVDAENPIRSLTTANQKGFLAAMLDGSVHHLDTTIPQETLKALLTHHGLELIPRDALK